ncbi:MAG: nucleotidyl transferase AbiEii/AbiGii toxin family protein [Alphaproteobacteria bacterium]|nr:nucleotidyl transferase AbiEii/AbiGii toxin family protein [Alphaproteobacteria bacterium]
MDKITKLNIDERKEVFNQSSELLNIQDFIIEKDFWVCWILEKLFSNMELSQILCFKGGTSLSKSFNLINRFSEDIDLILSQNVILEDGEQLKQASKNKQTKFNKIFEERAEKYISTILKEKISNVIKPICSVKSDDTDKHTLLVEYPTSTNKYSYVQPIIKLEIGPLALWNPNETYEINSFVGQAFPKLCLSKPTIPTIKPERSFWEKITILHHESNRPETSPLPPRYSRHYYDVFMLGHSKVKEIAFNSLNLLDEVVNFKMTYYPRPWAKYEEAKPGSIKLLPPKHNEKNLIEDYDKMKTMFYPGSKIPLWNEIVKYLCELEQEINEL